VALVDARFGVAFSPIHVRAPPACLRPPPFAACVGNVGKVNQDRMNLSEYGKFSATVCSQKACLHYMLFFSITGTSALMILYIHTA